MKKLLLPVLLLLAFGASAQKVSKKPIDHSVYDGWQSIANERISNDGRWIMYVIKPQEGDANLVITDSKNNNKFTIPRADTARITNDSKYIVSLIRPFFEDIRQAKIKKKKPAEFPKDTLAIIQVGKNIVQKFPAVRSFKIAEKAAVIAYLSPADTVKKPAANDTSKKAIATTIAPPTKDGAELTIRQLALEKSRTFKYVNEYQLTKNGKFLAFSVSAPKVLKMVFLCMILKKTP